MKKHIFALLSFLRNRLWYIILLVSSTFYIMQKKDEILQRPINNTNLQSLICILWVILLILPLFTEMEIFGVKLKKIDEVKNLVKEKTDNINEGMREIKTDIKLLNNNTNIAYTTIGLDLLPSKEQMQKARKEMFNGIIPDNENENDAMCMPISDDSAYLSQILFWLNRTLTNICHGLGYGGPMVIVEMSKFLFTSDHITAKVHEYIIQIATIASKDMQGIDIDKQYIDYVRNIYRDVYDNFEGIKASFKA